MRRPEAPTPPRRLPGVLPAGAARRTALRQAITSRVIRLPATVLSRHGDSPPRSRMPGAACRVRGRVVRGTRPWPRARALEARQAARQRACTRPRRLAFHPARSATRACHRCRSF